MFEESIQLIEPFVRPVFAINRKLDSFDIEQESATVFFINEFGCALTTYETANKFFPAIPYIEKYKTYKKDLLNSNIDIIELQNKHGFVVKESIVDLKTIFINCASTLGRVNTIFHPTYNLALLHFEDAQDFMYTGYAKFNTDIDKLKKGKEVMLLGYPSDGNENYKFDKLKDEIEWDMTKQFIADTFPIKSIITRKFYEDNNISHIEIGSFAYNGHEGSPLFDCCGHIYGMHIANKEIGSLRNDKTSLIQKFSISVSSQIITQFLKEIGVKFYQIEGDKEVAYNNDGKIPVLPKQLMPTVYLSGDEGSSIHVQEIMMKIGNEIIVDYKEPFQVAVGETDKGSRKDGAAIIQFSVNGDNEIFINEENAGSITHLHKNDSYELKVIKKEVSTNNWKLKASVKKQFDTDNQYFDILIIRRHSERNHTKDPHISFYPNVSGKYIRYDDEKSIKVSTKKSIESQNHIILPQITKIVSDEFEIEITYKLEYNILAICDLSIIDK